VEDKNLQQVPKGAPESKQKKFWKDFGICMLALGLSILTVLVLNV
jgi:hypothetical protein